jgi:hypothetical protein
MYVFTYLYNKLFTNSNKIRLEYDNKINIDEKRRMSVIKSDICNNICDMKKLRDDEVDTIKNMSHDSLLQLIGLLSTVNNNIIAILDDDESNQANVEKTDIKKPQN